MRKRFLVAGRVQGVGYRNFARHYARKMGLTGYAANLADGRVEVEADGPEPSLLQLEVMLRRGPPLARVTEITATVADAGEPYTDFGIR
jgi:acylphosphatase